MSEPMWDQRRPPQAKPSDSVAVCDGRPRTAAEVTALRVQLRNALADGARPPGAVDEDIERLLLVFEELTSNAVRHGRGPVHVIVTTTGSGWLIDVSDAATETPPAPAGDRDPVDGGMGLYLAAGLSAAHGWIVDGDRKHVWAGIDVASSTVAPPAPPVPRQRGDAAGHSHLQ
jgi:signal transduction histidine kinase